MSGRNGRVLCSHVSAMSRTGSSRKVLGPRGRIEVQENAVVLIRGEGDRRETCVAYLDCRQRAKLALELLESLPVSYSGPASWGAARDALDEVLRNLRDRLGDER